MREFSICTIHKRYLIFSSIYPIDWMLDWMVHQEYVMHLTENFHEKFKHSPKYMRSNKCTVNDLQNVGQWKALNPFAFKFQFRLFEIDVAWRYTIKLLRFASGFHWIFGIIPVTTAEKKREKKTYATKTFSVVYAGLVLFYILSVYFGNAINLPVLLWWLGAAGCAAPTIIRLIWINRRWF